MLTTMCEEAVNGWILTIWRPERPKQQMIYERLDDLIEFRDALERHYERGDGK